MMLVLTDDYEDIKICLSSKQAGILLETLKRDCGNLRGSKEVQAFQCELIDELKDYLGDD